MLYFYGLPILEISCVTTTFPPQIHIVVLGGDFVALPYTTYQAIREAAGLPDVVCGEQE